MLTVLYTPDRAVTNNLRHSILEMSLPNQCNLVGEDKNEFNSGMLS